MRRHTGIGLMIGAMAGIAAAVGLHTLLTAHPALASTWLGASLAWISAPGARLIALLGPQFGSHELGILAHWISLQLTMVVGGAAIGSLVGFAAERLQRPPPEGGAAG